MHRLLHACNLSFLTIGPMTIQKLRLFPLLAVLTFASAQASDNPKLTLDEFFNYVEFNGLKLSPDGQSVVISSDRADWEQNIFRDDLWLYRDDGHGAGTLTQLTNSGHDSRPQWSPDGHWIAFVSERGESKGGRSCEEASVDDEIAQLYVIPLTGGEAIAVTQGDEKVHAFAWSADSSTLLLRHAHSLDKGAEGNIRKRVERCLPVSRRRTRRPGFQR